MVRRDIVWQQPDLVQTFIDDVRGGVPYAADQIAVMLRVIAAGGVPVRRIADLGCGSSMTARAILAQHPDAQAVLVDFSEPMMAAARSALADQRGFERSESSLNPRTLEPSNPSVSASARRRRR